MTISGYVQSAKDSATNLTWAITPKPLQDLYTAKTLKSEKALLIMEQIALAAALIFTYNKYSITRMPSLPPVGLALLVSTPATVMAFGAATLYKGALLLKSRGIQNALWAAAAVAT